MKYNHMILAFFVLMNSPCAQTLQPFVLGSGAQTNTLRNNQQFTLGQTVVGKSVSKNIILTQGFHQGELIPNESSSNCKSPDSLPSYNIGEIAPQTLYGAVPLTFYICSEKLGANAVRSIEIAAPKPAGKIEFNPTSGKFSFQAAASDKGNYTIIFRAISSKDTVWQEVYFNVIPFILPEQTTFGLEPVRALPQAEDDDFVVRTLALAEQTIFNYQNRQTRSLSIAGKTIILDKNTVNKIHAFLINTPNDIKDVFIYAETIIIRSAIRFPQSNITIYARYLKFEDTSGEIASINTMPQMSLEDPTKNDGISGPSAGNLTLHILDFEANLGNRFRLIGGKGQSSAHAKGGNGGGGGMLTSTFYVLPFADLAGGEAGSGASTGNKGRYGIYQEMKKKHSWLHPFALKMVVAHAKSAYLNGYMNYTEDVFKDYIDRVENYRQSSEWLELSKEDQFELDQLQKEMETILHRIVSNLDYFGNPAGWVPMLSFEVNKLAFEQEIDRAIRILYFCYWVQKENISNQQKSSALQDAKSQQQNLLVEFQNNYSEAIQLLPQLQSDAEAIVAEMDSIQLSLEKLEQELTIRAEYIVEERHRPVKKSLWRKIASTVGTIATAIPVYQPALGAIGGGLIAISQIDFDDPASIIKNGTNAFKSFKTANFGASADDFKSQLASIDFTKLDFTKPSELKGYYEKLKPKADVIYNAIVDLRTKVGNTKVPLEEIQVELDRLKAESPEFTDLINRANALMTEKAEFEQKITSTLQKIATLTNDIQNGVLAIDGMNIKIFELDSKQDLRAMLYVKDLEKRAKDRLVKYHYYMGKAFEYRLVQPYSAELNLPALFDRFIKIVEDENEDTDVDLTPAEFEQIRAIYDDVLANVTDEILSIYNQNAPDLSAPVRFDLTKEDLQLLNAGQPVLLNMVQRGMFPPYEENIRIVGLKILEVQMHFENEQPGNFAYFDLLMEHSGISKIKKEGQVYLFNHYNNQNEYPIVWGIRYDAKDGLKLPKVPSASTESLLRSILGELKKDSPENLILYSRPAAWADIIVTKNDVSSNGAKMIVDKVRCEVTYDFQQLSTALVSVNVITSDSLKPYISLNKQDNNLRQDGWGEFSRAFFRNSRSTVLLKAPEQYGTWKFEKWTDFIGNSLSTSSSINVNLGSDRFLKANYIQIQPRLFVSTDTIRLPSTPGKAVIKIQNIGNGVMNWTVYGGDDWLMLGNDNTGENNGNFSFSYKSNDSQTERITKLIVIAPNSVDYTDTIVVIQNRSTTRTIDPSKIGTIKISPNPNNGEFNISFEKSPKNGLITIYNTLGQVVYHSPVSNEKIKLNLQHLSKGIYLIEFRIETNSIIDKIILE